MRLIVPQVCADYCQPHKGYQWCNYVYWNYNYTDDTATLIKSWDYCEGYQGNPQWTLFEFGRYDFFVNVILSDK